MHDSIGHIPDAALNRQKIGMPHIVFDVLAHRLLVNGCGHADRGRAGDDVLVLVKHRLGLRAVPFMLWRARRWVMFGGHFCFTSDSRFPSDQPIKIFDRVEGEAD